jgi:hypothetical protein
MGTFAIHPADAKILGCVFETLLIGNLGGYVNNRNKLEQSLTASSSGALLFKSSSLPISIC